jgi:hypothetical protein
MKIYLVWYFPNEVTGWNATYFSQTCSYKKEHDSGACHTASRPTVHHQALRHYGVHNE